MIPDDWVMLYGPFPRGALCGRNALLQARDAIVQRRLECVNGPRNCARVRTETEEALDWARPFREATDRGGEESFDILVHRRGLSHPKSNYLLFNLIKQRIESALSNGV